MQQRWQRLFFQRAFCAFHSVKSNTLLFIISSVCKSWRQKNPVDF